MKMNMKCPSCGFFIYMDVPDDLTAEELVTAKACPCGRIMETEEDRKARMQKNGEKEVEFYTLICSEKADGTKQIVALKQQGIEFEKDGLTLYAYSKGFPVSTCYVIDPETGLAVDISHYYTLDTIKRHVERNTIEALKKLKSACSGKEFIQYEKAKKMFKDAPRVDEIEE